MDDVGGRGVRSLVKTTARVTGVVLVTLSVDADVILVVTPIAVVVSSGVAVVELVKVSVVLLPTSITPPPVVLFEVVVVSVKVVDAVTVMVVFVIVVVVRVSVVMLLTSTESLVEERAVVGVCAVLLSVMVSVPDDVMLVADVVKTGNWHWSPLKLDGQAHSPGPMV